MILVAPFNHDFFFYIEEFSLKNLDVNIALLLITISTCYIIIPLFISTNIIFHFGFIPNNYTRYLEAYTSPATKQKARMALSSQHLAPKASANIYIPCRILRLF